MNDALTVSGEGRLAVLLTQVSKELNCTEFLDIREFMYKFFVSNLGVKHERWSFPISQLPLKRF